MVTRLQKKDYKTTEFCRRDSRKVIRVEYQNMVYIFKKISPRENWKKMVQKGEHEC